MPYILPSLILIAGLALILRWAKTAGESCAFCGGKSRRLSNLPEEERGKVLAYFHRVEDRVPEFDSVMACQECRKVKDGRIAGYRARGLALQCVVCKPGVFVGDDLKCPDCDATFEWTTFPFSGDYQFLVPSLSEANAPKKNQT